MMILSHHAPEIPHKGLKWVDRNDNTYNWNGVEWEYIGHYTVGGFVNENIRENETQSTDDYDRAMKGI